MLSAPWSCSGSPRSCSSRLAFAADALVVLVSLRVAFALRLVAVVLHCVALACVASRRSRSCLTTLARVASLWLSSGRSPAFVSSLSQHRCHYGTSSSRNIGHVGRCRGAQPFQFQIPLLYLKININFLELFSYTSLVYPTAKHFPSLLAFG